MSKKGLISIGEIADIHNRRKESIHKTVKRLGIETFKERRDSARGQLVSCITMEDYELLAGHLSRSQRQAADHITPHGWFYLVLLEPNHDPGRFKVGFTTDVNERMGKHKTAAPLLKLVQTWPCKPLWEKTAIECVTNGCEKLHTEVFRTCDLNEVIDLTNRFFGLMPVVEKEQSA